MAGDWIKIRTDLFEDSDVMRLSDILGTDDPTTVGLLVRFWAWTDKQTTDGTDIAVSSARIDRLVGREGFAEGMRLIGWLSGRDGSLCLPRFDRHNGNSAKARALESEAKRLRRMTEKWSDEVSEKSPKRVGQNVGLEKRREESNRERDNAPARRPTLAQAKSAASSIGVAPEMADGWWNAREASDWMKGTAGGGTTPVGSNWQADLKTYAARMASSSQPPPKRSARHFDSTNDPDPLPGL